MKTRMSHYLSIIRGARMTKDFWVDLKGNVWDYH